MAEFSGVNLTMNVANQSQKAEDLRKIVESIVAKIEEIDTEIIRLVQGGLEGSAVTAMANTYIRNREVVNDYVKTFAGIACVLDENAQGMNKINTNSETAAGSSSAS